MGDLAQHIEYIPFGEVFVEERNNSWSTPYKFNGKELDEETGLYYYGARYYDPRTSVWLSVDPLAEKFLNVSSYVYCDNNPINFIDPDGRIKWPINQTGNGIGWNTKYGWFGEQRKTHEHQGVDINKNTGGSTDLGLPVYSTHAGSVVSLKPYNEHNNSSGTVIKIQSEDNSIQTVYMHLNSTTVNVGDEISEGQQIGTVGGSGYGSLQGHKVHLHYEIRKLINGIYKAINPESSRGDMIDAQKLINSGANGSTKRKPGLNIYTGPTYLNPMPQKSLFQKIIGSFQSIFSKPEEPSPEFYQRLENERNNRKIE